MPSDCSPGESSSGSTNPDLTLGGDPDRPASPEVDPTTSEGGTILDRWGISAQTLTSLVDENPSLRGIMLGYVAEHKFREIIDRHPHVSESKKFDDHDRTRKSDRVLVYKGEEFSVEVKSLQTNSIKQEDGVWKGRAQVDGSDRRIVKFLDGTELNTTLLLRGQFDILAVNCFAFERRWNFAFALNRDLPTSTFRKYKEAQRGQLIASLVPVTWPPEPPFVVDPFPLVVRLYAERKRGS